MLEVSSFRHNIGSGDTTLVADPEMSGRIQINTTWVGSTFWILPGVWVSVQECHWNTEPKDPQPRTSTWHGPACFKLASAPPQCCTHGSRYKTGRTTTNLFSFFADLPKPPMISGCWPCPGKIRQTVSNFGPKRKHESSWQKNLGVFPNGIRKAIEYCVVLFCADSDTEPNCLWAAAIVLSVI